MKEDWFVDLDCVKWTVLQSNNALENCVRSEDEYLHLHEDEFMSAVPDSITKSQKVLS